MLGTKNAADAVIPIALLISLVGKGGRLSET